MTNEGSSGFLRTCNILIFFGIFGILNVKNTVS